MTAGERPERQAPETDEEKWPIGFMTIVGLAALYLLWRGIQMVGWLIEAVT